MIAESFEHIYRQNRDNIGLFTSIDFSLVERIRAGEVIGIDALAASIFREGGLLAYGQKHMKGVTVGARPVDDAPRTLVEKIMQRHALEIGGGRWDMTPSTGGFVHADFRFIHEYYTSMAAHMLHARFAAGWRCTTPIRSSCSRITTPTPAAARPMSGKACSAAFGIFRRRPASSPSNMG